MQGSNKSTSLVPRYVGRKLNINQ